MAIGRLPSCLCGGCFKCRERVKAREKYRALTLSERRVLISRRDPDKVRASDSARYQRDKPKRHALVSQSKARNPEQLKARSMLGSAVHSGRLARGPCAVCGVVRDDRGRVAQAHHADGYDRPLDVVWLCQRHHADHHKALRA